MSLLRKNNNIPEGSSSKANIESYRNMAIKKEVRPSNENIKEQINKLERQNNNEYMGLIPRGSRYIYKYIIMLIIYLYLFFYV